MVGVLTRLDERMEDDLSALDDEALLELSSQVNRGIGLLEGLATRITGEAMGREAKGAGITADEVARGHGEVSRERAAARSARAGLSEMLPVSGAAAESGVARPENADALAAAMGRLSPAERDRLAREDGDLARRAARDNPEVFGRHLKRRVRDLKDRASAGEPTRAERQKAASFLALGARADGMWWLSGEFDPERARVMNDRLRAAGRRLAGNEQLTGNHLAQALYDFVTDSGGGDRLGRARMGVGYIVDAATLFGSPPPGPGAAPTGTSGPASRSAPAGRSGPASGGSGAGHPNAGPARADRGRDGPVAETWQGEPIDPDELRRLACDADLYAIMINGAGRPGPSGQTHRSATRDQRLALRALYPTCPIDGITPFAQCEIHHVNTRHADGGKTELTNLVPIAPAWHHRCHEGGWTLSMDPDRTLHLSAPGNRHRRTIPPPTPITRQRE